MAGGPAQLSGEPNVEDVVLYVDGHHVEGDALRMGTYLRGDDIPGTMMSWIVKKSNGRAVQEVTLQFLTLLHSQGEVKNVELNRMSSSNIQDTRKVLEMISALRATLASKSDADSVQQLDRIYELWASIQRYGERPIEGHEG